MKKRKHLYFLIAALAVSNFVVGWHIQSLSAADEEKEKDEAYQNMELFTQVMEVVRKDYVDGAKLSYQDLTYSALKGMLGALDPHSQFMTPSEFDEMKQETGGQFGGIGVVIGVKDGFITIISPMEGTPGFKAGLLPGDQIIRVEGKPVEKPNLQEVVKQLRGAPGMPVNITIHRPKTNEVKDLSIVREKIKTESVKNVHIVSDKIGYVQILQFNEPTTDEFEKALQKLEKEGMNGLVIDLRNNPGGLLESAVDICGKFLPKGELVVYTQGRDPANIVRYFVREGKQHPKYPLAVLINAGSASGSEIVAGALQDTKRAVIVGETSFGKGSVQSVLPLRDGSAVRLTTAKYYTPSKKVIHEHGITPDIIVPMSEEDLSQIEAQRSKEAGSLPAENKPSEDATGGQLELKRENALPKDVQLDRAVDLLKSINIYLQKKKA